MRVIRAVLPAWRAARQRHDRERVEHRRRRRIALRRRVLGIEARARRPQRGAALRDVADSASGSRLVEPGLSTPTSAATSSTVDGWEELRLLRPCRPVPRVAKACCRATGPAPDPARRRRCHRARRTRPGRTIPELRRQRCPIDPLGEVVDAVRGVRDGHARHARLARMTDIAAVKTYRYLRISMVGAVVLARRVDHRSSGRTSTAGRPRCPPTTTRRCGRSSSAS